MDDVERATAASVTSIAYTSSGAVFLATNRARRALSIYNNGTTALYVAATSAVNTSTSFSVVILPNAYWEAPYPGCTEQINGQWLAGGSGNALVTEYTALT